jgi:aerobic-type carbon monoxide dehydrogenase small subunit (CoxS/CutS family)
MADRPFTLNVNGKRITVTADPEEPLLWILRDDLHLTGTKYGCGEGICGACSVLIDGIARRSCRLPVSSVAQGQRIVTIEGLAEGGRLTALQRAFIDYTAFCCGFCTPGMIISATALLASNPNPTREEIINAMDWNFCRCGSYLNVIEAIEAVAAGEYT